MNQIKIQEEFREMCAKLIEYHFDENTFLKGNEKKLYDRLIEADRISSDDTFKNDTERAQYLAKKFDIHIAAARRDMIKTMEFFTQVEIIDIATSFRLLLRRVREAQAVCKKAKNMKEYSRFFELEFKILDKLSSVVEDPRNMNPTINVFLSGEIGRKSLGLENYNRDELISIIQAENLEKDVEEKLIDELRK
jgi:hypothetical protein